MKKLLIVVIALLIVGCDGKKDFGFDKMSMGEILQNSYNHWVEITERMRTRDCGEAYQRIMTYVNSHMEELQQLGKAVQRVTTNARDSNDSLRLLLVYQQKMQRALRTRSRFSASCPTQQQKLRDKLKF